jgi:hypothetical protein
MTGPLQTSPCEPLERLRVDQPRRLKELEWKNPRFKKIVADQALDVAIFREAASQRRVRPGV